ncbi:uncharacterized protein WM294_012652 [Sarcoramphus papa]
MGDAEVTAEERKKAEAGMRRGSCPQWQSTGAQRKMLPSIPEHWKGGERRLWSLWQERELLSPFRKQRRRAHRPLGGGDHGQTSGHHEQDRSSQIWSHTEPARRSGRRPWRSTGCRQRPQSSSPAL